MKPCIVDVETDLLRRELKLGGAHELTDMIRESKRTAQNLGVCACLCVCVCVCVRARVGVSARACL